MPVLSRNENLAISEEALILKVYFVETDWDHPENETVDPIEVEIEFEETLGNGKSKTRAKVYRPVILLSDNFRLLIQSPESLVGRFCPVAAGKFGTGFLLHTELSIDEV